MHKDFIIGETKYIELDVISRDGADFAITDATWQLLSMGNEIQNGSAEINGHRISVLLTPPAVQGQYKLVVFYTIPPETIGAEVVINVEQCTADTCG